MPGHRNWLFTLNNPKASLIWTQDVQYAVYQLEKVTTNHFQGYVEFSGQKSLTQVSLVVPGAHWEPRRGSQQEAITYCTKKETRLDGPWEFGHPKRQGERRDLEEIKTHLLKGTSDKEISLEYFGDWIRYGRAFKEFRVLHQEERNWKTEVIICIGPTGTGKTKWATSHEEPTFIKENEKWWDGYTNQHTIVIDEFYGWIPYNRLLRLCDEYPMRVETKGGTVSMVCRRVIITSNKEPEDWYGPSCYFEAFARRVAIWKRFIVLGQFIDFTDYTQFKNLNKKN